MIKQINFDYRKLFYQKKYLFFIFSLVFLSFIYTSIGIKQNLLNFELNFKLLLFFRPIYWLLCCYIISDIITSDYHFQTLKTILPHTYSRTNYLSSKFFVTLTFCYSPFLALFFGSDCAKLVFSIEYRPFLVEKNFLVISGSILVSLFCLACLFFLSMILTGNEVLTISLAFGVILLCFILESFEPFTVYLPTMWMLFISQKSHFTKVLWVLLIWFLGAIGIAVVTFIRFCKKDLFI